MDAPALSPLTADQATAVDMAVARAAGWAGVDGPPRPEKVQEIYDAFLEQGIRDFDRLATLGIAFGQLLVDRGALEWVRVQDQHGEEVCVAVRGKQCFCAPISMMQKRIERDERLSVEQLCQDTLDLLDRQSQKPGVGVR